MKIKYRVTLDDLVAFNIFHYRNSAYMKRSKLSNLVFFPAGLFLVMCLIGIVAHSWQPVINGAIICVSLILWTLGTWEKRLRKNSRKFLNEGEETSVGTFELEITADNITEEGKYKKTIWSWDAISKLGSTPEHIFAYTSATLAIVIPQAGLIEGSYEEFLAELKQFFEKTVNVDQLQEHDLTDKIIVDPKSTCHTDTRIGKQSGLGIASLIISILVGGSFLAVLLAMVVVTVYGFDESEPMQATYGIVFLLGIAANLTGVGLGIAGLFNKCRKKNLSILGLVFNCIILSVLAMLVAFGMVFG